MRALQGGHGAGFVTSTRRAGYTVTALAVTLMTVLAGTVTAAPASAAPCAVAEWGCIFTNVTSTPQNANADGMLDTQSSVLVSMDVAIPNDAAPGDVWTVEPSAPPGGDRPKWWPC